MEYKSDFGHPDNMDVPRMPMACLIVLFSNQYSITYGINQRHLKEVDRETLPMSTLGRFSANPGTGRLETD